MSAQGTERAKAALIAAGIDPTPVAVTEFFEAEAEMMLQRQQVSFALLVELDVIFDGAINGSH